MCFTVLKVRPGATTGDVVGHIDHLHQWWVPFQHLLTRARHTVRDKVPLFSALDQLRLCVIKGDLAMSTVDIVTFESLQNTKTIW